MIIFVLGFTSSYVPDTCTLEILFFEKYATDGLSLLHGVEIVRFFKNWRQIDSLYAYDKTYKYLISKSQAPYIHMFVSEYVRLKKL